MVPDLPIQEGGRVIGLYGRDMIEGTETESVDTQKGRL